jgi:tetratricopeptide (TPR) repeat protein
MIDRIHNSIRDCTEVIRARPDLAEAHQYRGEAYLAHRRFERAIADLERASLLDQERAEEITPLLGIAYYGRSREMQLAGRAEDATIAYEQARARNPDYVRRQSVSNGDSPPGDATGAIAADTPPTLASRDRIELLKPVQAAERCDQGQIHLKSERYDDAIREFTEALRVDPRNAEAYLGRGLAFFAKGFPDTALADFGQAILYDPMNADAFFHRASAHFTLENEILAIRDCTAAIRWNSEASAAYVLRAKSYLRDGQLERARADIEESERHGVADAESLFAALEKAYLERGRRNVARQALENAAVDLAALQQRDSELAGRLKGDLAQAYYDRAMKSVKDKALDRVEADLEQLGPLNVSLARELKDRLAKAYHQRGLDRRANGGRDAAASDLRRAEELGWRP